MSLYYAESNSETTRKLFIKRNIYRNRMIGAAARFPNIIDFNFAEKQLYGRVNRVFTPITFNNSVLQLKQFDASVSQGDGISAINFVVDAFNGLNQQFAKCATQGKISKDDPYLSTLRVFRAYVPPHQAYNDQWRAYMALVDAAFKAANVEVKDFDEFIKELMIVLNKTAATTAFTQPAFTKSRRCSIQTSGLAVEIANLNASNDFDKIVAFVRSPNWGFYVNACNSYGFMVDQWNPWRLVADIGAPAMIRDYVSKYGVTSTQQIIDLAYSYTHGRYYRNFKYYLLNMYNHVRKKMVTVEEQCGGRTIQKRIQTKTYSMEELTEKYSESYFLELYCRIRFLEEESSFPEYKKISLTKDTIALYNSKSLGAALEKFERIINKTFDYSGSMSYIIDHRRAVRDSEGP
ncbi:hypothetical protein CMI47_20605 [Candidatus Pacearchaeota archaeon]|nr:hypothetical protein [Candidatus Pacearchaeota archaeon]